MFTKYELKWSLRPDEQTTRSEGPIINRIVARTTRHVKHRPNQSQIRAGWLCSQADIAACSRLIDPS
jgi:hypothetical protein